VKKDKTEYRRPYVIGICGGPSSGKSSVAKLIKNKLPNAVIINLIHFYKPIRGNLRRRSSRADSMVED
jgi:uridine kinase